MARGGPACSEMGPPPSLINQEMYHQGLALKPLEESICPALASLTLTRTPHPDERESMEELGGVEGGES